MYGNIKDFKNAVIASPAMSRGDFLYKVRHATIKDITPFACAEGVKEISFMQAFGVLESRHS